MQREQEKELAAIKERQRNMKEMTEEIERENEKLKRLTKGLVEARKTHKKFNEEFAQLRQNDYPRDTTQAIVHSNAQQYTDSIEFPDDIDNTVAIDSFTASKRPRSARMRIVTRGNLWEK
jgi:uncharacterized phage infection (PIP) family protein YhgE